MKHCILFVAILFFYFNSFSQNAPLYQTVRGTIVDEQSGNVLKDVTVSIADVTPFISGLTDSLGNFKLERVPIGRLLIRASFIGYEEAIVRNIEVTSSKEVILEIKLTERITRMD